VRFTIDRKDLIDLIDLVKRVEGRQRRSDKLFVPPGSNGFWKIGPA